MSYISLKVTIVDLNTTKTLQFSGNMTVSEVCREIRDRIGDKTSGASDHGIYFPFLSKWLASNKTLDSYDLKSGDAIEFKKKHRPMRVKLMDDTVKTVLIDESAPVAEVVDTICKRIGISNPEEYSLQKDENKDEEKSDKKDHVGLKRKQGSKENISSEESKWLNPEKTLTEQGVQEIDVLLLKKKFFFSDQNIDRNDPIQLNLVYVQSRDAIISGKHPCTFEESCQLAALQFQVQFGNHEPDKHKPGFIKIKEFIPPEYHKDKKEMEKKVFQEHRKLQGLSEINAKFRYVQLCRSLKTYGVTFFLVKEKIPKKNKLEPRLLGVTRDRIMRVDAETKDIIKEWPLTTLRRWAAAPNSFTLDFGDYADSYYSVQTNEGEQISQLIAGYIDIILKKRKEATRVVQEEEEQLAISEDSIKPVKATAVGVMSSRKGKATEINVAMAGVVNDGEDYVDAKKVVRKKQFAQGVETAYGEPSNANLAAQQGLLQNINNGYASINAAVADLAVATQLPPIGNDPASVAWKNQTMEMNRQVISSQVGAQIASTAALVNLTSIADPEKIDYATLGQTLSTMSTNMQQIASSAKMLAALLDGMQGDKLIDAARALALATQKMLQNTQPYISGDAFDNTPAARAQVLAGGQELSKNAFQLMLKVGDVEVPQPTQVELIDIAKQVAQATVGLVTQGVKPIANECSSSAELQYLQPEIVGTAKQCAAAAEALVTTTMIAAPAVNLPASQDQIFQGTLFLKDALDSLQKTVDPVRRKIGPEAKVIQDLNKHTVKVRDAIARLVKKAKNPLAGANDDLNEGGSELDKQYDAVLDALSSMLGKNGMIDSPSIINGAKGLTIAATQLVNMLKSGANDNSIDENERSRLLGAAKALAEATARMVGLAKDAARAPGDQDKVDSLHNALLTIEQATMTAAGSGMRKRLMYKLINVAKQTANSSTQLISAAKSAAPSNLNQESQMQLNQAAKKDADIVTNLVTATRNLAKDIDDSNLQLKLISAAKQILGPGDLLVSAAKEAAATTRDENAQTQLLNCAIQNQDDLSELQRLVEQAENASAGMDFTTAVETLKSLQLELNDAKQRAAAGTLKPAVFHNLESVTGDIQSNTKGLISALAQLVAAASQGNEKFTGVAARDASSVLQTYAIAVKGLAALNLQESPQITNKLLENASALAKSMLNLVEQSKRLSDGIEKGAISPGDADRFQAELLQLSRAMGDIITATYELLPGQRDVEQALKMVGAGLELLEKVNPQTHSTSESFTASQNKLNGAASALAMACNALVAAARNGNAQELKAAANQFEDAYQKMISASQSVVAQTSDDSTRQEVIGQARSVAESSSKLLQAMKGLQSADGGNNRGQLNNAAKNMADSISQLLESCTQNAPGIRELNKADQALIMANGKVDGVNDPSMATRTDSYFDCLRQVTDVAKQLVSAISAIPAAARQGDTQKIGQLCMDGSNAVVHVTDATTRAAYLIGVSDPSSVPPIPGLLDQEAFVQSANEVKAASLKLTDPKNNQAAILNAASIIAKHTSTLCNNAKQASINPKLNAMAKQQFVQAAKNVASATAALVQNIKQLAGSPTDAKRNACQTSSLPLIDAIDNLVHFASSPEFIAIPAKISPLAQQKQQPLVDNNKTVISLTQDLVGVAKTLCSGKAEPSSLQMLLSHSKGISDSLRALANAIKQGAPGQRDCDEAIDKITASVTELDAALLQLDIGSGLSANNAVTEDSTNNRDALLDNVRAISSLLTMICKAAKGDVQHNSTSSSIDKSALAAGQLGNAVIQLASNFQPTISNALTLASSSTDKNYQKAILEKVKDMSDNTVALLGICKESGGDANAKSAHQKLDETMAVLEASLSAITDKLEGSAAGTKELGLLIKSVEQAMRKVNSNTIENNQGSNENYQSSAQDVFKKGKALVDLIADTITKSSKPNSENIIKSSQDIANTYQSLVLSTQRAASVANDPRVKQSLLENVRELGGGTMKLLEYLKTALVAASGTGAIDANSRQKVTNSGREVSAAVSKLMNSTKEGSKGLIVCEQAKQLLEDVISDLESQIIFAQAGQLDPIDAKDNFSLYKDGLTNVSKDLLEVSKAVVSAAASGNQDELAQAVAATNTHVNNMRDNVKKGAVAITSSDKNMQEQLLLSTKSVADGLLSVITTAMIASGKPMTLSATGTVSSKDLSQDVINLRNAAKQLVSQLNDFAKLIKLLGDESSRGLRAIEGARKDIETVMGTLSDGSPAVGTAMPEEVAAVAKNLATAAASLVSISARGNNSNQEDLVAATNQLKKEIIDLVRSGKAATDKAPGEKKALMLEVCKKVSNACLALLDKAKSSLEQPSPGAKSELQNAAKDIAGAVNSVVDAAGSLIPGGYVDPNDPNVIAERELLAAASSIEAAARKLAMLKPPVKPKEADENLNFEEQILEAAKSIAAATGALIKSATSAQRELVAKGKASKTPADKVYFSDGTWNDGLVSAAKAVALATGDLCEAANAAIKGEVQRERVIAAARAVNASTQQLLSAASAKADILSQSQVRLKAAGKSVTSATEQLVKAAEESMAFEETEEVTKLASATEGSMAMQRAKELEAQAKILQMEKELEMARGRLHGLRKGKYQK